MRHELVPAGRQGVLRGPLERRTRLEKCRVDLQCAVQAEAANMHDALDRDLSLRCSYNSGWLIHPPNARFNPLQVSSIDQVNLIENDHVGEGDLFARRLAL